MVYPVILIIVISSLLTMVMCFNDKKAELENFPEKRIKNRYVLFSSALFGSIGVIMSLLFFGYQKENRKFIFANIIVFAVQAIIVYIVLKPELSI